MKKGCLSPESIERLRGSGGGQVTPPKPEYALWDSSVLPFTPMENVAAGARFLWGKDQEEEPAQGDADRFAHAPETNPEDGAPSEPEPSAKEEPPQGIPEYNESKTFEEGVSAAKNRRTELLEYYMENNLQGFSDSNVLELLLHFAIPYRNTSGIADRLLRQFGSLPGVLGAGVMRTRPVSGMTREASALLDMLMRVAQRAVERQNTSTDLLNTDEKVGEYLTRKFFGMTNEMMMLLCLDNSCRLISCTKLSSGISNRTGVDVRAICETAFRCNAPIVILAHNHPGGKAYPSDEDIRITVRIQKLLRMVDVNLVDHFIIAGDQWKSMAKMGELSIVRVTDIIGGIV